MKKYKIFKKCLLIEKPYLGKEKDKKKEVVGTADNEGGITTITIKQNLSDEEKFSTVCHEVMHLFEMALNLPRNQEQTEKICDDLGKFIIELWNSFPPFRRGLIDSSFTKARKK